MYKKEIEEDRHKSKRCHKHVIIIVSSDMSVYLLYLPRAFSCVIGCNPMAGKLIIEGVLVIFPAGKDNHIFMIR